jgi:hypothetical protein
MELEPTENGIDPGLDEHVEIVTGCRFRAAALSPWIAVARAEELTARISFVQFSGIVLGVNGSTTFGMPSSPTPTGGGVPPSMVIWFFDNVIAVLIVIRTESPVKGANAMGTL